MKRTLSLFLALVLLAAVSAACSGTGGGTAATSPPLAAVASQGGTAAATTPPAAPEPEPPMEVTVACVRHPDHVDWDQMFTWQKHYEDTGIKINWVYIPSEGRNEQKNLMIATREYPDAFWGCHWTMLEALQYIKDGIFIPIDEYLPEYGPNITRVYEEIPTARAAQTMPDGHIYSYGQISRDYSAGSILTFRKGWLEKLGLDYPTTTDEFMSVMMAMKEGDPNGQGVGNVYPWSGSADTSAAYTDIVGLLLGSWGLGNRGAGVNSFFDADPADESKLRCYITDDRFREILQFVRQMEVNGLIDPEASFQNAVQWGTKVGLPDDESWIGVAPSYVLSVYQANEYFQGPNLPKGPYGDELYPTIYTKISNVRKFNYVVTDKCQNIPAALGVVDYWMAGGDQTKMFYWGEEGTHYTTDENGVMTRADWITADPQGRSAQQMICTFSCQPGGFYPALFETYPSAPNNLKPDTDHWMTKIPKLVWEGFNMLEPEIELTSKLNVDLTQYYNESLAAFVTGAMDINSDADWASYKATLDQMGMQDHQAAYQAAYDRFLALQK